MYLSSGVVRSDQHLSYFLCQHDLEVLGSAPTRKKRFCLPWWFSTASQQICSLESESGLQLSRFLNTNSAARSKAFPVNDHLWKKGTSFLWSNETFWNRWMWPALGQFAERFFCCCWVSLPWSQWLGTLPNGKTSGQMADDEWQAPAVTLEQSPPGGQTVESHSVS